MNISANKIIKKDVLVKDLNIFKNTFNKKISRKEASRALIGFVEDARI
jgi:hypothetical protein